MWIHHGVTPIGPNLQGSRRHAVSVVISIVVILSQVKGASRSDLNVLKNVNGKQLPRNFMSASHSQSELLTLTYCNYLGTLLFDEHKVSRGARS